MDTYLASSNLLVSGLDPNPDASFGLKFVKTIEAEVCNPLETAIGRLRSYSERLSLLIQRADNDVKDQG